MSRPRGRGASSNPANPFQQLNTEPDPELPPRRPQTEFLPDASASLISYNDSPDVPFDAGINPYRGCEHGCVYCYARPLHEYLGYSAGLDFETKIHVKHDAPEILKRELAAKSWTPQTINISGATDPYQPVERELELTRRCLAVLAECRNPVGIITKNALVTRDLDHLQELAMYKAIKVLISVTTLDDELARKMEPRTSSPRARLAAIQSLAEAGVPVGTLVGPVIPGLTDHELPSIVQAVADAGGCSADYIMLRLPLAVADLFETWLGEEVPTHRNKVLDRIGAVRGGKRNSTEFGSRMRGEGLFAEQTKALFEAAVRKAGLKPEQPLSTEHFRRPQGPQLELF